MDYTPNDFGVPAARHIHLQSSDEQQANNNVTAQTGLSSLPQPDGYQHHSDPSPGYGLAGASNGYHDAAFSSQPGYDHPPTPPRHEDHIQKLMSWHTQQHAQHQASDQVPRTIDPNAYANLHGYARTFSTSQASLPDAAQAYQYGGSFSLPMRQAQPYGFGHHQDQQPSSPDLEQAHAVLQQMRLESESRNPQTPSINPEPPYSYMRPPSQYGLSSYEPAPSSGLPYPHPPIQQWPMYALGQQPRPITPPQQYSRTITNAMIGPSPGHDGIAPIDQETLRKQKAFQKSAERSAEKRRRRNMAEAGSMAAPKTVPTPKVVPAPQAFPPSKFVHSEAVPGIKRKRSTRKSPDPASKVASKRRKSRVTHGKLPDGDKIYAPHPGGYSYVPADDRDHPGYGILHPVQQLQADFPDLTSPYVPMFNTSIFDAPRSQRLMSPPEPVPLAPPAPIDWDAQPQDITANYADYKWSVTLYQLNTDCGFDFAESWLEKLFETNDVKPPSHRWKAHSSQGFIKDGDRLSFIALHNAADPFEWGLPPTSTTSLGMYGRFWHEHDEVHWKTFAPDIRLLLDWCRVNGGISVKQTWKFDNPRAAERRFHRAYWLAARMESTKDLMHHRQMRDPVHDAVTEEIDDGFDINEEALQGANDWDRTDEQSEDAWKGVLAKNERIGDVLDGTTGFEHVIIGSTETDDL